MHAEGLRGSRPRWRLPEHSFEAEGLKHRRVADFRYVWTSEGTFYVAVVLNLSSLQIVGWSMKSQVKTEQIDRRTYRARDHAPGWV